MDLVDRAEALGIDRIGDGRIRLRGELDMSTVPALRTALLASLDGRPRVELDLAELVFLDSSGLCAIGDVAAAMSRSGGVLVLQNAAGIVRKVLEIVQISRWPGVELE